MGKKKDKKQVGHADAELFDVDAFVATQKTALQSRAANGTQEVHGTSAPNGANSSGDPALPSGWTERFDDTGLPYYENETGHSQWERPTAKDLDAEMVELAVGEPQATRVSITSVTLDHGPAR